MTRVRLLVVFLAGLVAVVLFGASAAVSALIRDQNYSRQEAVDRLICERELLWAQVERSLDGYGIHLNLNLDRDPDSDCEVP